MVWNFHICLLSTSYDRNCILCNFWICYLRWNCICCLRWYCCIDFSVWEVCYRPFLNYLDCLSDDVYSNNCWGNDAKCKTILEIIFICIKWFKRDTSMRSKYNKMCLQFFLFTIWFQLTYLLQVVQEYERAVIFRLGRLLHGGSKGPGMYFFLIMRIFPLCILQIPEWLLL